MIRIAREDDAEALLNIYTPYVKNSAVTFECSVPDTKEFCSRIRKTLLEYPYLVAVEDERIVGYAYAGSFHSRAAYKHTAEVSIYIDPEYQGRGIGKALYGELEKLLVAQNVNLLCACITETDRENDEHWTDASIRFHEKMGYVLVGRHYECGYKFEKWYSIIWMEKLIAKRKETPDPFIPYSEICTRVAILFTC